MKNKTFAVLGLGIFGSTVAKELSNFNLEVIAVDMDMSCVERVAEFCSHAVQADIADIDQLRQIGVQDCDCAVIATSCHLEDSIMAIMNCKELGVPYIVAKAKNKKHKEILEKVGADRVVRPEKEMGMRTANSLVSPNIIDLIDVDDEYSIVEIVAPKDWIGKTLRDLALRNSFGVNVLGVRRGISGHLSISPSADYLIDKDDYLLVIAENKNFSNFELII